MPEPLLNETFNAKTEAAAHRLSRVAVRYIPKHPMTLDPFREASNLNLEKRNHLQVDARAMFRSKGLHLFVCHLCIAVQTGPSKTTVLYRGSFLSLHIDEVGGGYRLLSFLYDPRLDELPHQEASSRGLFWWRLLSLTSDRHLVQSGCMHCTVIVVLQAKTSL